MRMMMTAVGLAGMVLAGCGNGGSAVETRDREAEAAVDAGSASSADVAETADVTAPEAEAEAERGRPMWSSTRRYTADQNAQRAFDRNGAAFGAASVDAYVQAAHAFITNPPAGTETASRRNGDTLYYHAASNTFAVSTREGAPRTMFKPDDGPAYWAEQLEGLNRQGGGEG